MLYFYGIIGLKMHSPWFQSSGRTVEN